jgi:hypothetical protein
MKKTLEPETPAAEPVKPVMQNLATKLSHHSEHVLLARIMASRSNEELLLLHEILEDCASDDLPLAQAALRASAHALGLRLFVEEIADYAEDFNGLNRVTIYNEGWLYQFLHGIFQRVNAKDSLNPEDVMGMVDMYLRQLDDEADTAREFIRSHPELLKDEIRKAVHDRPELVA